MEKHNQTGSYPRDDYCGKKFGRLLVIKWSGRDKWNVNMWMCSCDCGNEKVISQGKLKSGNTKSCGCLQLESRTKHGFSTRKKTHPLYHVLDAMKQRCYNQNCKAYKNYGGRGIEICKEWLNSYQKFIDWGLKSGWKEKLMIERIDVNGNYEPQNCCFISHKNQQRNRRDTNFLTYNGQTKSIPEWAEIYNLKYSTLVARLNYGWGIDEALTKPVSQKGTKK